MAAKVKVLVEGYVSSNMKEARATISLVLDKDVIMVVDPGVLEDQQILVEALKNEGLTVDDVNIVCITHSHLDHYRNVGMFKKAKVLEYFGLWDGDKMEDWQEDFSQNIKILKTPGHDNTSITLFVRTDEGVVAICGDVFWKENYPGVDPFAQDLKKLEYSRELVLEMSHWIIPGHSGMYKTKNGQRLLKAKMGEVKEDSKVKGSCKKCHKPFVKLSDKCLCQEWLCYRCCECEFDCNVCNCKRRGQWDIRHKR